jgi:hypothetical protein
MIVYCHANAEVARNLSERCVMCQTNTDTPGTTVVVPVTRGAFFTHPRPASMEDSSTSQNERSIVNAVDLSDKHG